MYSPKISPLLIPIIYQKAKQEKKPMTKIVNEILSKELLIQLEGDKKHGTSN